MDCFALLAMTELLYFLPDSKPANGADAMAAALVAGQSWAKAVKSARVAADRTNFFLYLEVKSDMSAPLFLYWHPSLRGA
jgi:hypothetical protein